MHTNIGVALKPNSIGSLNQKKILIENTDECVEVFGNSIFDNWFMSCKIWRTFSLWTTTINQKGCDLIL